MRFRRDGQSANPVEPASLQGLRPADSRFFRELARFDGTAREDGTGSGTWNCAPLDVGHDEGYRDVTLTVTGTWQIAPLSLANIRRAVRQRFIGQSRAQRSLRIVPIERPK